MVKIESERLADLNVARAGHTTMNVNGEPMVIGGHTTNFVPTPTAEYYKDGAWHVVQLAYCHDNGCAVELSTGNVLIAGGHEKEIGIGQTFLAELYNPVTHTSIGFASLDTKRALAMALALDSGKAVISGNWHHEDAIEMYDGKGHFLPVKGVTQGRCTPFILRTARDNALIVGGGDTLGKALRPPIADRLHGEPLQIPLLEQWHLYLGHIFAPSQVYFIGDEAKDDYSYLLLLENDQGQLAIARVTGEEFALLPTDVPIPTSCKWGEIKYYSLIVADRKNLRAYIFGADADAFGTTKPSTRIYVVTIDYTITPAHLSLGYTDVLPEIDITPILNDDGNLMLTGGTPTINNFQPTAATWLLHVSPRAQAADREFPWWGCSIAILAATALTAWLVVLARRRKSPYDEEDTMVSPAVEEGCQEVPCDDKQESDLIERICHVMEQQQLYLNPDLKVDNIATALNTNRRAISDCINSQRGTFRQFLNTYRLAYAKKLLRNNPDITITDVWMSAGFSSESTFFRIFKAATGVTPTDWRRDNTSL